MSEITHTFAFSGLEPVEIPFSWAGKNYVLREGSADVVSKFKNKLLSCARVGEDGDVKNAGMQGLGDLGPLLVAGCTFEKVETPSGTAYRQLNEATIRQWPERVVKELYEKASQITPMDDEETVESLDKQIELLQKKKSKLLEGKDSEEKN
jgi:hypothetical protein